MMRGEVALVILNLVAKAALNTSQIFEATIRAGYGASMGKIDREHQKLTRRNDKIIAELMMDQRIRNRYHKMLHHLSRQGLLEKNEKGVMTLTPLGQKRRDLLLKRQGRRLPRITYTQKPSARFTIVVFDVPEKERDKRAWLRQALRRLRLRMIQQSVWVGKVHIPKVFLDDLRQLKLVECIEIFEVSKAGTLRHIV